MSFIEYNDAILHDSEEVCKNDHCAAPLEPRVSHGGTCCGLVGLSRSIWSQVRMLRRRRGLRECDLPVEWSEMSESLSLSTLRLTRECVAGGKTLVMS